MTVSADPMDFLLSMIERYGPMRLVDVLERLTILVHRDRRALVQRAVSRGFLVRNLDPNINVRVLCLTEKKYVPLDQRAPKLNVAGPRTIVNSASREPIPPDRKLPGRKGQDEFKQYMRKYRGK